MFIMIIFIFLVKLVAGQKLSAVLKPVIKIKEGSMICLKDPDINLIINVYYFIFF